MYSESLEIRLKRAHDSLEARRLRLCPHTLELALYKKYVSRLSTKYL